MVNHLLNKLIKTYFILKAKLYKTDFLNQKKILFGLIKKCKNTVVGNKYKFSQIKTIKDFQSIVPVSHYNDIEEQIHSMLKGEKNISYPGKITWFATSSGTTGGPSKYIPVTKESLKKSHFRGGEYVLNFFCKNNPQSKFLMGKGLVIGGGFSKNPYTGEQNVGFISAILQKTTPKIMQTLKEPKDDISYIDNREEKVKVIIKKTIHQNITFINGQPGRLLNFLYSVLEYSGKKNILEVRPNLELFFWGGLSISPYKEEYKKLIPSSKMQYYQIYNASEGCFAVQDKNGVDDMLLLTNHGTFYEFIPFEEYGSTNPRILTLKEVEIGKEYVIIITTCSGLRRYVLGDIIKFTNLKPRKIQVIGRTKYFIDILGERLSLEHIEKALLQTCKITNTIVTDFMVGPIVYQGGNVRGCHERVIEFTKKPNNEQEFAHVFDQELCKVNGYYYDERHDTKVIGKPVIHCVNQGVFYQRLKSKNKLGGQHKIPKVGNDRKNLDEILSLIKQEQ